MSKAGSKNKKHSAEKSPQKDKNKANRKEKESLGKENNCMNKTEQDEVSKEKHKSGTKDNKASPATKMKKGDADQCRASKASNSEPSSEEAKIIEDFEHFLKDCCKSKRKILIKPNIPKKWINYLKAKLAKVQLK